MNKSFLQYIGIGLAVWAAFQVFGYVRRDLQRGSSDANSNILNVVDKLEIAQALKELYPSEYRSFLASVLSAAGSQDAQPTQVFDYLQSILAKHSGAAAMASSETLQKKVASQIDELRYVQRKFGSAACNSQILRGASGVKQSVSETDAATSEEFLRLIDHAGAVTIRAAAEGERLKIDHGQPIASDLARFTQYALSNGMTQKQLDLVKTSTQHADDPALCGAVLSMFDALLKWNDDAAVRMLSAFEEAKAR